MLSKKIVRFLKSGCLIISIGFLMEISGCKGNTEQIELELPPIAKAH